MSGINDTHDPNLRSWVESANDAATDFPIQNLPFCAFAHPEEGYGCVGVRIGDSVLDLGLLHQAGVLGHDHHDHEHGHACEAFEQPLANAIAEMEPKALSALRRQIQQFLDHRAQGGQKARRVREKALFSADAVTFTPPVFIANYTDFYASVHHASTVGSMFRPDNPLLPNYKHVPIGYHGRASSIITSGGEIRRPRGQQSPPESDPKAGPSFGPCAMLDYELELGCFIGPGNRLGEPIPINQARDHIFGFCLLNDWSARDIQKWEYQPLGPFLAKNFATSISPCVVTLEALEPFRARIAERPAGDPKPLPYLLDENDQKTGALDITLEVYLQSAEMANRKLSPVRISRGNAKELYWSFAQMVAHHTSNGCNLTPGDLLGSGTISGPTSESRGCLLELTWDGPGKPRRPIELPTGEKRTFLADGDTVIFKGFCEREGFRRVGFGECRGTILPTSK